MRDVQLFATSTLQKPWSGKRGTSPFMSSKQKINLQEVYNFQVDGKKRIQQFFHDTELMPKELLFIGRNLNIIR